MELKEALELALRVSKHMTKDPEAESLAGLAAWKAHRTFDETKNVPWEAWVFLITKQHVISYWRKKSRQEIAFSDLDTETFFFSDTVSQTEDSEDLDIPHQDWRLLMESRVLLWPHPVLERRYKVSNRGLKKMLRAAEARLMAAVGGS